MSNDKQAGEAIATLVQVYWPAFAALTMGGLTWAGKKITDWLEQNRKEIARLRSERDREWRQNVEERERQLDDLRQQIAERDRENRALQLALMQIAMQAPGSGASKVLAQLKAGELKGDADPDEPPPPQPAPPHRRRRR